jgi:hypothetical protein
MNTQGTNMKTTLRHLLDFELEANGWAQGDIRLVRRVLTKGAKTPTERRVTQRYQALRREIVALETERAAEHAAYVARYDVKYYGPDELALIPHAEQRDQAIKVAELWPILHPNVPFHGVKHSYDRVSHDGRYAYYITADFWPVDVPRMYTKDGRLCASGNRRNHQAAGGPGYDYATPKVGSVLSRALNGKPLFVGEVV